MFAVDREIGRGRDWTGRVVFYSMLVDYPGVEPNLESGACARDVDSEQTLPLKLD